MQATETVQAIEGKVAEFVEGYECDTGEGIYKPNEHERFLIDDAIRTFLEYSDITKQLRG